MDEKKVKERIKNARENGSITQQEMADELGISRRAYNSLEKGSTRIINDNVWKIAKLTDTSVEELVLGYRPEENADKKLLEERLSFENTLKEVENKYSKRISELENLLSQKDKLIENLQFSEKSKEDIIRFQMNLLEKIEKK